jgi:predicted O-methyltransferase YrrM
VGIAKVNLGVASDSYNASPEYNRRHRTSKTRALIELALGAIHEPRFITGEQTGQFIEALIVMIDAQLVLELGMYSGFTTLHMIRGICGKEGAKVFSIDPDPTVHDVDFFSRAEITPWFQYVEGSTPGAIYSLKPRLFDVVFVDSDHSIPHVRGELAAVMEVTRPGSFILFHDCNDGNALNALVESLGGMVIPSALQQDGHRPNLGIVQRK